MGMESKLPSQENPETEVSKFQCPNAVKNETLPMHYLHLFAANFLAPRNGLAVPRNREIVCLPPFVRSCSFSCHTCMVPTVSGSCGEAIFSRSEPNQDVEEINQWTPIQLRIATSSWEARHPCLSHFSTQCPLDLQLFMHVH